MSHLQINAYISYNHRKIDSVGADAMSWAKGWRFTPRQNIMIQFLYNIIIKNMFRDIHENSVIRDTIVQVISTYSYCDYTSKTPGMGYLSRGVY